MPASSVADAIQGALNVVTDPCLRDVAGLLFQLHELEQKPLPGVPVPTKPVQPTLGIGLCKAVKPLQLVIYLRQNPWVTLAGAVGVIGLFVGVGYRWGQRSSARKSAA